MLFFQRLTSKFWISSFALIAVISSFDKCNAELTPPYFNLAEGRHIDATATCGADGPELYCKLVGANTEHDVNHLFHVIQGQVCDYCDLNNPDQAHPPDYAIDGTSKWWQSPPLSRGMKYNEVNLTIDFGQEFHVAYVFVRMGNSPRPGVWTLQKSSDYGKTWKPWQHFADSEADCETYFPGSLKPITRDDDVICTTEYSKIVPLEDGEIPIRLLNNRPSANNYFNSTLLQEWTRATNVRFVFLRTKNLLGHLMSVARQDPTVTRRYFYSIKDISIGGRCMCNGHADTCSDLYDSTSPTRILACDCRHNTTGIHCNECRPGFEQKKWLQNTRDHPFQCEPCNCHGHSADCKYDEEVDRQGLSLDIHGRFDGGGVCQNCQDNTDGTNCNKCKPKYYRPYGKRWDEVDVCKPCNCETFFSTGNCEEETGRCECRREYQEPNCDACSYGHFGYPNCRPCECNLNGTEGYFCESVSGRCPCKPNYAGDYCERCADGFYGPNCLPCDCDQTGSVDNVCDRETGQCVCHSQFDGRECNRCKDGYFGYPSCQYCNCDVHGTVSEVCDKATGKCLCKEGYTGTTCANCFPGFYSQFSSPDCIQCNCSLLGSVSNVCDASGKCPCLSNFAGKQCNQCSPGYYNYPECLPCNCDSPGSNGISCNADGQCSCFKNFDSKTCGQCKEGFYNYPACEECNCDPGGVIAKFAGCGSVPAGELCQCKERATGRICNDCKPSYWNLNISNPLGCDECDCFEDGTLGALNTCNTKSGQCPCKPSVQGRVCNQCKDGTYDLFGGNLFGCRDCNCDIGGSINDVCDKTTGQCKCHPRVTGQTCSHPLTTHYYPTLHQNQYEFEDGYTPSGSSVRYEFEESAFPGFSKRGYAKFSKLQSEIISEVNIIRSSVYRVIIRYVNPSNEDIVANILVTSDNPNEVEQTAKVLFKPSLEPQFVTVSGGKGDIISAIVLDPGRYTINVKTDQYLLLDYFVLLPAAYYEATILSRKIVNPCELNNLDLCRHYQYPSIDEFKPSRESFVTVVNTAIMDHALKPNEIYSDPEHLDLVKSPNLPLLNSNQPALNYILDIPRSGRYIIVVDYVTNRQTPETYNVNVRLVDSDQPEGIATLYSCLYSTTCRQPVIDDESREQDFYIDINDLKPVQVYGEEKNVAIKAVTAIPIEEWSIDLITPSPACVMKNRKCEHATFRAAPYSKKIELENENDERLIQIIPLELLDDNVKLAYLDRNNSTLSVHTKVPHSGRYNVILKYYQPNHSKFDILYKIDADKINYDGKLNLRHCPSNSGCRELFVQPNNGGKSFDIEDNVTITITNTHPKSVWLDYIVLIPDDQFDENLLDEVTFDQSKEFIDKCGQNNFHIPLNASDFCKQAVFSLTSDYNSGALPCNCDYEGSTSFECEPFGGQCQCKPNIIGRQCDACRTGFYGFPDCKPCDCPSKSLCEKETGACICAPHVIGDKCDKCEPYAFNFDQYWGCEPCECSPIGVVGNNLQCDLYNGSCNCLPNVEGRRCDSCEHGFFSFPACQQCRCNVDGTTYEICDESDETCLCKKYVQGQACDRCVDGYYNLQKSNSEGCTKCFCFGKTTRCSRAYLRPFDVSMLKEVSVNTITVIPFDVDIKRWDIDASELFVNETTLEADLSLRKNSEELIYFGVLDYLLDQNNHLTAYGGRLTYSLYATAGLFGKGLVAPDVILEGKDLKILHRNYEQPASEQNFYGNIKMIESSFTTIDGKPVTREQFMHILRALNAIYIRATYWDQTVVSYLSDVYLQMADEDEENISLYEELSIERCQCPPGYTGNSCEDCAPGFYRDPKGPHGGYCVPCQCNGHAETCDVNTGKCINCKHSTTGDHCDQCIEGYYGNAKNGQSNDCLICACPLPIDSNNFATGCEVSEDGSKVHCICREGYSGETCQSCAPGYYGDPRKPGDYCKPCECSGNIDINEVGACDSVSGECLKCKNNTFGAACNICKPGFYGDAVESKNCQNCVCDPIGMEYCDSYVGTCHCHPNVIGSKCDRCEADHYGFESGRGCFPCDCAVASNSTQCEDSTGECRCKPGVTGRQCDRCSPGYWNYSSEGCLSCSCNDNYSRGVGCNDQTGQCECLPGVIGEKCDSCPHRWVFVADRGCHECDTCHHALIDVTDSLANELDPVIVEFKSSVGGYFTQQKLTYYDQVADEIEPKVKALDPNGVNLTPIGNSIDSLENDVKNFERKVRNTNQTTSDKLHGSLKLLNDSRNELTKSRLAVDNVQNVIYEVGKLADSFESDDIAVTQDKIGEAQQILNQILPISVDTEPARLRLDATSNYLAEIERFAEPVNAQNRRLNELETSIGNFTRKLNDLNDWASKANRQSADAERQHLINKNATLNLRFDALSNQNKEILDNIAGVNNSAIKCRVAFGEIYLATQSLSNVNNELKAIDLEVKSQLPERHREHEELDPLVDQANHHLSELQRSAQQIKSELTNTTPNSENALRAAHAYSDIIEGIDSALNAVRSAKQAVDNATELTSDIDDRAGKSDQKSRDLLGHAQQSLGVVQSDLKPHIDNSTATVQKIKELNDRSDLRTKQINLALDLLPLSSQSNVWETARDKAIDGQEKTDEANRIIRPIVGNLGHDVDLAQRLPKQVDDTNYDISKASNQIDRLVNILPNATNLIEELTRTQDEIGILESSLGDKIADLKRQIETARALANDIKVGVQFYPNTTLELKQPENLGQLATDTQVSAYVRTEKPNGFLMFLGNSADGKRGKHDDFLALEVENGYPVLTVDFGKGPERIVGKKNIADGRWYQVVVDRKGNDVKLTVRDEVDGREVPYETVERLSGPTEVFDLNPDNTRLFVGGFPEFDGQTNLRATSFEGAIEGLRIGDQDVGLWNFLDSQNNNEGAQQRNRLLTTQASTNGYRFGGQGYLTLDAAQFNLKQKSNIRFEFKAGPETSDGLLFYGGKNRHFISVELRNGTIVFQYKIGQHSVLMASEQQFNDDRWHAVEAVRFGRSGALRIDGIEIGKDEIPEGEENLKISDRLYFGGHPNRINHTEVVKKHFEGCIANVSISSLQVDLSSFKEAYDIQQGCKKKFSTALSYLPLDFGYLRRGNISANNLFQIDLKFRTRQGYGLLFYAVDVPEENTIGLYLQDGSLVLRSQGISVSTFPALYNDSEWHTVKVSHDERKLRLIVDDAQPFEADSQLLLLENAEIYFGGVPNNFHVPRGAVDTAYFVGCIDAVLVNGQLVNFAESIDRKYGVLEKCPADIFDYNPSEVPIVYPEENLDPESLKRKLSQEKEQKRLQEEAEAEAERVNYNNQLEAEKRRKQEEQEHERERPAIDVRVGENENGNESENEQDNHVIPPKHEYLTTSTTVRPTKRRNKHPESICKLPVDPEIDEDFDAGYRFGTRGDSRIEFSEWPAKMRKSYEVSLQFKTSEPDGVLFYAADQRHTDFVALYLRDGYVVHAFSCGSAPTNMTSKNLYNDDQWHTVVITRDQNKGKLVINGDDESFGEATGSSRAMNLMLPYSFGGVNDNALDDLNVNLSLEKDKFFSGCIRNIMTSERKPSKPQPFGVIPCSENVEQGVFFGKGGGHIKLKDRFKVGLDMTISMDIKPRTMNGLLLSVHGKKALLLLQLINGTITFTVNNGDGDIVAVFKPDETQNFCDGAWHSINAVKSKYVITLTVDGVSSQPSIGNANSPSTDTSRPLFLGGHPFLGKARGLTIRRPFLGCVRNVKIKDKLQAIQAGMTVGNVQTGVCPLN